MTEIGSDFNETKKGIQGVNDDDDECWLTVKLLDRLLESTTVGPNADRHGLSKLFSTVTSVIETSSAMVNDFVL